MTATEQYSLEHLTAQLEAARTRIVQEPFEIEEVQLIVSDIVKQISRLERMINVVLLRPGGISENIIGDLHLIKVMSAHLRWHTYDQQLLPAEASDGAATPG